MDGFEKNGKKDGSFWLFSAHLRKMLIRKKDREGEKEMGRILLHGKPTQKDATRPVIINSTELLRAGALFYHNSYNLSVKKEDYFYFCIPSACAGHTSKY